MNPYRLALVTACGGLLLIARMGSELQRRRRAEARIRDVLSEVGQRVSESTLELAAANDLKDRFLATVSHELRTPLNAIVGWVQVLKAGAVKPAQMAHVIDAIDRNAQMQARLVNDLLDVSRMMQGRLTILRAPVDLLQIVDDAVAATAAAAEGKALTVECRRAATPVTVIGDEERLRQMVHHLLANAVKFTPRGGMIRVRTSADGAYAVLVVADSGEGLAPETLPHVFSPFFQAKSVAPRSGLGLGLTIVKELAALHGGDVQVESAGVGRGATFTVRLPLTRLRTAAR